MRVFAAIVPVLSPLVGGETGVNLSAVLGEITALIPKVLPVVIGFIAFRKGLSFIQSSLRGA